MSSLKCAIVVSDKLWRDANSGEESEDEEHLAAADYLRLDSMVHLILCCTGVRLSLCWSVCVCMTLRLHC